MRNITRKLGQLRKTKADIFNRLGKEIVWIALGQILTALGAIIGVRLLTDVLPPAGYGELALSMTAITLVQQTIVAPFVTQSSLRYFAPALEVKQLSAYLVAVRRLIIQTTAIVLGLGGIVLLILFNIDLGQWIGLGISTILFGLFFSLNAAMDGMQNAARHRAVVAVHQAARQWARFLVAVAFISIFGAFSSVAMTGYVVASVVILYSQWIFFRRKILSLRSTHLPVSQADIQTWLRQMHQYAWPFVTWGIFAWAQLASDRWALRFFGSASDVGVYAALYQLGYFPISLTSAAVIRLIAPILFSKAGDGTDTARLKQTHRMTRQLVWSTVLLTGLGAVVAFFFHELIFSYLVAAEYRFISNLLPFMVLWGGIFASSQVAVLAILSDTKSQMLILPKMVTAVIGVSLNIFGAYWFGANGVIAAGVVTALCYFIWIIRLSARSRSILEAGDQHTQLANTNV
ncbi:MAG: oligosaccharide flippase family protein [Chloroflexota bacterium]